MSWTVSSFQMKRVSHGLVPEALLVIRGTLTKAPVCGGELHPSDEMH